MNWQDSPDSIEDDPVFRNGSPAPEDSASASDLEGLLRQLPLREPSAMLDERIARILAATGSVRPIATFSASDRSARRAMLMGAAAMLAVGFGLWPMLAARNLPGLSRPGVHPTARTAPRARPIPLASNDISSASPVLIEQTFSRVEDRGVITVSDGHPLQFFHKQSVRSVWIVDPRDGVRTSISVPVDEIVMRPVQPF